MHWTIQVDAHHLGNPTRVIAVALVDLRPQERLGVARLDADHGQSSLRQTLKQPLRQWASFEPDPFDAEASLRQDLRQILKMADDLGFSANSSGLIDDADGGLFHRNIQTGIKLHAALPP